MDEPTNHLDLEACVWLEEELKNYKQILVIISHSQVINNILRASLAYSTKQLTFIRFNALRSLTNLFLKGFHERSLYKCYPS